MDESCKDEMEVDGGVENSIEKDKRDDQQEEDGTISSHDSTSSSCEDQEDDDDKEDDEDENESEAESSEFDEDINIQTRDEYLKKMQTIEQYFNEVSKRLYVERRNLIDKKLKEVGDESSPDYINGVKLIDAEQHQKLRVIDLRGRYHHDSLKKILEADKLACAQQLQNDKQALVEQFQNDLDDKLSRLQEDRDNIDMSVDKYSDLNSSGGSYDSKGRKLSTSKPGTSKSGGPGNKRKKKPVTVTGPYIVYMLREEEIMSDLQEIRKAVSVSQRHKARNMRRHSHACRYEDGKLIYSGRIYQKGQRVSIRKLKNERLLNCTITGINSREVLVRQANGTNSKIYLHQLHRGRVYLQSHE